MPRIARDVLELIGNTPLVRLGRIAQGVPAAIVAKLEFYNPVSSIKDRLGVGLIRDAEERGLLKKNSVIIEATFGNAGLGLGLACSLLGYRLIIVMPEQKSADRVKLIGAFGAEIVQTPREEGIAGAMRKAEELAREIPNSFLADQFKNPANAKVHRETTAREIWNDTDGLVDAVVCGIGTGGTITGIAEELKPRKAGLRIFGVEPATSAVLSGEPAGPHKIQGIGAGFVPEILKRELIDEVIKVRSDKAIKTARRLIREEGLFCGISSGAAVWAALEIGRRPEYRDRMIVAILPDTAERYLNTELFST
jgi:cysteine synthase A